MTLNPPRLIKSLLVSAIGLFFLLVVFNNVTDYSSNFQFVKHVLSMDTTFPGNRGMWRAITGEGLQHAFYAGIILWEAIICFLCLLSALCLFKTMKDEEAFIKAKTFTNLGLGLSLLLWFMAFMTVGAEWFLMWQSEVWNGQDAAFRMFAATGIVLIYLNQKD